MLFLKKSGHGYALVSPYYPSLPALRGVKAGAGDVLSKIVFHLGAVVESESTRQGQRHDALFALGTIRNSESTALLRRALEEKDDDLRLNAAAFLLERNDISGLEIAERALMNQGVGPSTLNHNLDFSIGQGVKNEKAVPILSRLAGSQDAQTRRAAASALRHTGSRSALKPLAAMLDDSDFEVRYEAVLGLAQITGNPNWVPNMDRFRSEEGKYIKHWHDWKAANDPN